MRESERDRDREGGCQDELAEGRLLWSDWLCYDMIKCAGWTLLKWSVAKLNREWRNVTDMIMVLSKRLGETWRDKSKSE